MNREYHYLVSYTIRRTEMSLYSIPSQNLTTLQRPVGNLLEHCRSRYTVVQTEI